MMTPQRLSASAVLLSAIIALATVDGKSLTFVIDTTGSMRNDIAGVKAQVSTILAAAAGNPEFTEFVLVPFNDPG